MVKRARPLRAAFLPPPFFNSSFYCSTTWFSFCTRFFSFHSRNLLHSLLPFQSHRSPALHHQILYFVVYFLFQSLILIRILLLLLPFLLKHIVRRQTMSLLTLNLPIYATHSVRTHPFPTVFTMFQSIQKKFTHYFRRFLTFIFIFLRFYNFFQFIFVPILHSFLNKIK